MIARFPGTYDYVFNRLGKFLRNCSSTNWIKKIRPIHDVGLDPVREYSGGNNHVILEHN
jgi:hypothetical protein